MSMTPMEKWERIRALLAKIVRDNAADVMPEQRTHFDAKTALALMDSLEATEACRYDLDGLDEACSCPNAKTWEVSRDCGHVTGDACVLLTNREPS